MIGTSTYVQSTDYEVAGRVDLRKLGADVLRTDYVYYAWTTQGGRMQVLKTGTPGNATSLQSFTYTYDNVGSVKTILDAKNSNQKQCFTYDALNRLTKGTTSTDSPQGCTTQLGNGNYDESYAYDGTTGNLSSKGGQTLSYGDANHKHAATAWNGWLYTYDANGNMLTRVYGGTTYTLSYDSENRMTGMTGGSVSASFVYDGDGNRVKGTVGGVTTAYVGNYFEWTGSTSTMKKYYYAGGARVAMRIGSATPLWLLGDHLGSTSKVANSDGLSEHSQQLYKPWGEKRYPTGTPTLPTTWRFTGQRQETGLGPSGGEGLYFYNSRWYDPLLGRFSSPDTDVPESQGVQAFDRYAYVNNSPVRYIDPTGHKLKADDEGGGSLSITDLWDPEYEDLVGDPKAAQQAFLHFLSDPQFFLNLYAIPEAWASSLEAKNLDVFLQYSEFHTTADRFVPSFMDPEVASNLQSAHMMYGVGDGLGNGASASMFLALAGVGGANPNNIGANGINQLQRATGWQFGQFRVGNRIYDGRIPGTSFYLEVKTTTRGIVYPNSLIRSQIARDMGQDVLYILALPLSTGNRVKSD